MPTGLSPTLWSPFKGINTASPPHLIGMESISEGFDFVIENNSKISKRYGYSTVNSTAVSASPTINSLGSLYKSNGTNYEVIGTSNGGVWSEVGGVVTASVFTGLSTTQPFNYTQMMDTLIVLDGNNIPYTWVGTATATITAAATGARYGESHLNKFFAAGITSARSRLDYSATNDFNIWTGIGTDQIQVSQNDGQNITGIKSFSRNELVIFKDRSMYKLIGYDKSTFNLLIVDKNIGCVSNRSIQNYKASSISSLLIFAYRDGIYVYDGSVPKKISSYIQDFWNTINFLRFETLASTIDIDNGRYILSVPTGSNTTNNRMIIIDLLHPWEDENGLHFPIFLWRISAQSLNTEITTTTNLQRIVFGGITDGIKYNFGSYYSDNGTAIESYFVTPLMTFGDGIAQEQCLRRIYSSWVSSSGQIIISSEIKDGTDWVTQETVKLTFSGDAIGVDFQIGASHIGTPESSGTKMTRTQVRSRRIKIRFYQSSSTQTFTLQLPVEFYTKPGGHRP